MRRSLENLAMNRSVEGSSADTQYEKARTAARFRDSLRRYMKRSFRSDDIEERFNGILEKYDRFLRNTIVRMCPKGLGLQFNDIQQEARLQLWRAIESEREISHPGSYIYRIAISVTLKAIQRAKARREEQLRLAEETDEPGGALDSLATDPNRSPEALAEQSELIAKIEQALARLPENRRLAVGLYLKGMSTEEISDLMGWSEPKARNLAYRGLKDLRDQLRAEGIEYGE
jgi:RNA polymerase sigma-70 factor (ECF subfamily)